MAVLARLILSVLLLGQVSHGLFVSDMYPFGQAYSDTKLDTEYDEDISSAEIKLGTNVKFFSREYRSIFVNENGLLSFLTEIPSYFNIEFPLDYPIIAVLYSDVDCRGSGSIWYRVDKNPELLQKAKLQVQESFMNTNFDPEELFIATWDQVGYFEERSNKVNTYQVVIVSDETDSYVIFNYPQSGLQWIKGLGKNRNMPDARAQVGIISGEGRHYLLPGSGYDQVQKLDRWSNTNKAGIWMFKVGKLDDEENIFQPTIDVNTKLDPYLAKSCEQGHLTCHGSATCQDVRDEGFCCQCINGWYGDGRTCLPKGIPQRVTGKVNGNVNDYTIFEQELHCYVVTEDGRTYTAISKIDKGLGEDIQALTIIGTPIAWLFALPSSSQAQNGFSITGGRFNYTAEVKFPKSRHIARVKMNFQGLDAFDYLKASVSVEGSIPRIRKEGSRSKKSIKVSLEDTSESFVRTRPGLMTANSKRMLGIEGHEELLETEITQTIEFTPGCIDSAQHVMNQQLSSNRNFIVFDVKEGVARYALTSTVDSDQSNSPCQELNCDKNSFCVLDQDQAAKCECKPGFIPFGPNTCADINECATNQNDCSEYAECINNEGSHTCLCLQGYLGNGTHCTKKVTCEDLECDENAECLDSSLGQAKCQCLPGYQLNGTACQVIPSHISLSGLTLQSEILIDPEMYPEIVATVQDIGPLMEHTYEVVNSGPSTVRNLQLRISWPLKDSQDRSVTYLHESPEITVGDFSENCQVDESLINPRRLSVSQRNRRSPQDYDGDYYADNLGVVVNNHYDDLTPEEKEILESYDLQDYDYSQFDNYNQVTESQFPHSSLLEKVALGEECEGFVTFICSVNLAPQESAQVSVQAHIFAHELEESYQTVSLFTLPSIAEILPYESIVMDTPDTMTLTTQLRPSETPISNNPGQGSTCGARTCNKYADCNFDFGLQEYHCRCVPGFQGDGYDTCERAPSIQDCRVLENCNPNAECSFDEDTETFACFCLSGFVGNGEVCRPLQEPDCSTLVNCSPSAQCVNIDGDYKCQCNEGYEGDGYECRLADINAPKCVFGACICPLYKILDGTKCADDFSSFSRNAKAIPQCYGTSCACPKGYQFNNVKKSCDFTNIIIPSTEVHCDLNYGTQCGNNAQCIYDSGYDHSICQCNEGYIGDGFECQYLGSELENSECSRDSQCLLDEKCVLQSENGNFARNCVRRTPEDISGGLIETITTTTLTPVEITTTTLTTTEMQNTDLCQNNQDCHQEAGCDYDYEERRYLCKCHKFFVGDGVTNCVPGPDAGCDITDDCDLNAECVSEEGKGHKCHCNDGFQGDGKTCEKLVIGCNVIDNCDKYASCLFSKVEGGYRCKCDTERGFEGDGLTCKSVESCNINPIVCDPNAFCMPVNGKFSCQCKKGYLGDGHTCEVVPVYDGNFLVSSQGSALMKIPMSGQSPGFPIVVQSYMTAAGIDVDCFRGKMYWTDTTGNAILRGEYEGGTPEIFLNATNGLKFPEGIAIDWLARNVYWADSGTRTINVANLDTKGTKILLDEKLKNPRGIAVDPSSSRLFWTDWDRKHARIESAFLDGSDRKIMVDASVGMPNALAMDFDKRQLCWTDGGTKRTMTKPEIKPKIECISLDGSNRKPIVELQVGSKPYGISISDKQVFWTDWNKPNVHVALRRNGEVLPPLSHIFAAMGKPYAVRAIPAECPQASSACQSTSGICGSNELCLPNGRGGRSCVCFDGYESTSEGCVKQ